MKRYKDARKLFKEVWELRVTLWEPQPELTLSAKKYLDKIKHK